MLRTSRAAILLPAWFRPRDTWGDERSGTSRSEARQTTRASADTELNDSARAAASGDAVALEQFLLNIAPVVRRVCKGVMGTADLDLEDAIQDCLFDVARAIPQFRFEASVTHYVTKIAMRRAICFRRRSRARSVEDPTLDVEMLPGSSIETTLETKADIVSKLLDELDDAQATALLLRVVLGHSIDEIAAITGVSVNTVKTRIRLAKSRLREWLKGGTGLRAKR